MIERAYTCVYVRAGRGNDVCLCGLGGYISGCSVCVCGHACLRVFMRWVHVWMFRMCMRALVPACVHEVGTCLDVPYVCAGIGACVCS